MQVRGYGGLVGRRKKEGKREHLKGNLYSHLLLKFKKPERLARIEERSPRVLVCSVGWEHAGLSWEGLWERDEEDV